MDKIFQYAVIYHPRTKEKEEPKRSELLVPVTTILAKDEKEVALRAAREVPETYLDKLDRVEIAIRPF